jgi:predicted SAM-dependent methyltransferase
MPPSALRLNLGCGEVRLEGFVNVDALDGPAVDAVANLAEPLPFEDAAAELVYASHVLEHFPTDEVPARLADWRRVLAPGGLLLVAVPDLDVIARRLVDTAGWFTPPHNPWLGAIFGGQKNEYDFHKTGFTGPWLAYLLANAGFGSIERVDRFQEVRAIDASFSPLPFGENVSLNMRAVAGGRSVDRRLLRTSRLEQNFDVLDRLILRGLRFSARARASIMYRRRRRLERTMRSGTG